jgi:hypothetical protein
VPDARFQKNSEYLSNYEKKKLDPKRERPAAKVNDNLAFEQQPSSKASETDSIGMYQ